MIKSKSLFRKLLVQLNLAIILGCFIGAYYPMYSQSSEGLRYDTELWSEISLSKEISKRLDADLSFNFRHQDTFHQLKSKFYQAGIKYDIFNFMTAGIKFRYYLTGPKPVSAVRWAPEITLKHKIGPIQGRLRNRFQSQLEDEAIENTWRCMVKFRYKKSKAWLIPGISYETFYHLNPGVNNFVKNRALLELNVKLDKIHSIAIDIGAQQEMNVKKPQFDNIIALSYSMRIP